MGVTRSKEAAAPLTGAARYILFGARTAFADRTVQGILRAVAGLSATPASGPNYKAFPAGTQPVEGKISIVN